MSSYFLGHTVYLFHIFIYFENIFLQLWDKNKKGKYGVRVMSVFTHLLCRHSAFEQDLPQSRFLFKGQTAAPVEAKLVTQRLRWLSQLTRKGPRASECDETARTSSDRQPQLDKRLTGWVCCHSLSSSLPSHIHHSICLSWMSHTAFFHQIDQTPHWRGWEKKSHTDAECSARTISHPYLLRGTQKA